MNPLKLLKGYRTLKLINWFKEYAKHGSVVYFRLEYRWTVNTDEFPAFTATLKEGKGCGEESNSWENVGKGTTPEKAMKNLINILEKR